MKKPVFKAPKPGIIKAKHFKIKIPKVKITYKKIK